MRNTWLMLALGWTAAVAVACLVTFTSLPEMPMDDADKGGHFIMHFVFGILWLLAFRVRNREASPAKLMLRVLLMSFIFGGCLELAQQWFTTTRHGDLRDMVANMIGAFAAVIVWYACDKFR